MKKIEAISVCVNYSKYFKFCIPRNQKHFYRWIVVTTSKDEETIELCKKYNLELVIYDGFTDEHGPFQKSKGINQAFKRIRFRRISREDFLLHIDSDIVLPDSFTNSINSSSLKVNHYFQKYFCLQSLYGINRCELSEPITNEKIDELFLVIEKNNLHGVGSQNACGYFQLFSKRSVIHYGFQKNKVIYPEMSRNAEFDDHVFSLQFDQKKGIEMTCIHLGESCVNWNGINYEKG